MSDTTPTHYSEGERVHYKGSLGDSDATVLNAQWRGDCWEYHVRQDAGQPLVVITTDATLTPVTTPTAADRKYLAELLFEALDDDKGVIEMCRIQADAVIAAGWRPAPPVPQGAKEAVLCPAHGRENCDWCSLTNPDAGCEPGECDGCSFYAAHGMHWDTCPNRAYRIVWITETEAIEAVRKARVASPVPAEGGKAQSISEFTADHTVDWSRQNARWELNRLRASNESAREVIAAKDTEIARQRRDLVDLGDVIAVVKTHYQRRCENLTRARDERQAQIDAALAICGHRHEIGSGAIVDLPSPASILDEIAAALSPQPEATPEPATEGRHIVAVGVDCPQCTPSTDTEGGQ